MRIYLPSSSPRSHMMRGKANDCRLIDLLERILLEESPFSENESLQNLLLLSAAKSDKARVMDYVHKLDKYSPQEIADLCIANGLYEESLAIFRKQHDHVQAATVLVEHIVSIERSQEYAEEVDEPAVWAIVSILPTPWSPPSKGQILTS